MLPIKETSCICLLYRNADMSQYVIMAAANQPHFLVLHGETAIPVERMALIHASG
jgi:hypothetical protein